MPPRPSSRPCWRPASSCSCSRSASTWSPPHSSTGAAVEREPMSELSAPGLGPGRGPAAGAADGAPPPRIPAAPPARELPADRPRALKVRTLDDVASLVGAAVGSLSLVWILYSRVLPLTGTLGFLVCWY